MEPMEQAGNVLMFVLWPLVIVSAVLLLVPPIAVSLRVGRTVWPGLAASVVSLGLGTCWVLFQILGGGFLYAYLPYLVCSKCSGLAFTILAMTFFVVPLVPIAVATPIGVYRFINRNRKK